MTGCVLIWLPNFTSSVVERIKIVLPYVIHNLLFLDLFYDPVYNKATNDAFHFISISLKIKLFRLNCNKKGGTVAYEKKKYHFKDDERIYNRCNVAAYEKT